MLNFWAILAIMAQNDHLELLMKKMSAKEAKNGLGVLIDNALVEPVTIEKHGMPVFLVFSIENFEKMKFGKQ